MHLVYISEIAVEFIVVSLFVYITGVAAVFLKATAPYTRLGERVRLTAVRLGDVGCSDFIIYVVSTASVTNNVIHCKRIMHDSGVALSQNTYTMGFYADMLVADIFITKEITTWVSTNYKCN